MPRTREDIDRAMRDLRTRRITNPPQNEEEKKRYTREYQALYRLQSKPDLVNRGPKILNL